MSYIDTNAVTQAAEAEFAKVNRDGKPPKESDVAAVIKAKALDEITAAVRSVNPAMTDARRSESLNANESGNPVSTLASSQ